jgi:hypothetical protein
MDNTTLLERYQFLADDMASRNIHVKHLVDVMTAKCECGQYHQGVFNITRFAKRFNRLSFFSNTERPEYDEDDEESGDDDYVTSYECVECGRVVEESVAESIAYLTGHTRYTLMKRSALAAKDAEMSRIAKEGERPEVFTPVAYEAKARDIQVGRTCRTWSFQHSPSELIGTIIRRYEGEDGSARATMVSNRGVIHSAFAEEFEIGATTERVGGFIVMHRVSGDWVIWPSDETRAEGLEERQSFASRELAIVSVAHSL